MRAQTPDIRAWFFSSQASKSAAVLKVFVGSAGFVFLLVALVTSACLGQFARDAAVERGVGRLVLILETYCRQLQRVENVAEVELRHPADALAVVSHCRAAEEPGSLRGRCCRLPRREPAPRRR